MRLRGRREAGMMPSKRGRGRYWCDVITRNCKSEEVEETLRKKNLVTRPEAA